MLDSGRKETRLSKIKIPKPISISQDKGECKSHIKIGVCSGNCGFSKP